MIARLSGTILSKNFSTVIIDVGNIGYEVQLTRQAADRVQEGDKAEVFIAENIREDSYQLYGFSDMNQRALYYQLTSVSGVGPKAAMAILSGHDSVEIETAISTGNTSLFSNVSGIGNKTASRIVLELRGKLELASQAKASEDPVYQALMSLGFSAKQAGEAIKNLPADMSTETKVKEALKVLAK